MQFFAIFAQGLELHAKLRTTAMMTDLSEAFSEQVLREILGFVTTLGTREAQAMLLLWRQLSKANRTLADGAAKLPSVADHLFLSMNYAGRALKKFAFFIDNLKVDVKKLTIVTDKNLSFALTADHLEKCPQLQSFTLTVREGLRRSSPHLFSAETAAELVAKCAQLQTVNFEKCTDLTDAVVEHIAKCTQLHSVGFAYCSKLTDAVAEHLAKCEQLQSVNFADCWKLTDAAVEHLAKCVRLQSVDFKFCVGLTDVAAEHLAKCAQLQRVKFAKCRHLTDASAEHLAKCAQLRSVDFSLCTSLTHAAAEHFAKCVEFTFRDRSNFNQAELLSATLRNMSA